LPSDQELPRGLLGEAAPGRAEGQDREPLRRRAVRSVAGRDPTEPCVVDPELIAQQRNLRAEAVVFGGEPDAHEPAIDAPAPDGNEGEPRQSDGVKHAEAGDRGPVDGQTKRGGGRCWHGDGGGAEAPQSLPPSLPRQQAPDHRVQPCAHRGEMSEDLVARNPHDPVPAPLEPLIPPRIEPPPLRVVSAIDLHHEADGRSAEVGDVLPEHDLLAGRDAEPLAAERLPEPCLRRGGDVTHPGSALSELCDAVLRETNNGTWQASLLRPAAGRTQPTRRRLHDARGVEPLGHGRCAAGNVRLPARPARCRAERSAPGFGGCSAPARTVGCSRRLRGTLMQTQTCPAPAKPLSSTGRSASGGRAPHLPHARSARNAGAVRIRGRSRANGPRVGAAPQLNPVAELDGAGVLTWQYVYGSKPNVPDYAIRVADGARYRIVSDQLGSVVLVVNVDDVGDVLFAARYSAFGEQVVLSGDPAWGPFGFAGGRYDPETGLVRFGARDYDPTTGRWTAKDPAGFVDGANLYPYGSSDSVNRTDPTGRDFELDVCAAISNLSAMACRAACAATFMTAPGSCDPGGGELGYLRCVNRCLEARIDSLTQCLDDFEKRELDRWPTEPCYDDVCFA